MHKDDIWLGIMLMLIGLVLGMTAGVIIGYSLAYKAETKQWLRCLDDNECRPLIGDDNR